MITKKRITRKQINEIASASKRFCARNGYGHQVIVHPDGWWTTAISSTDVMGWLGETGEHTVPILRIGTPTTRADVLDRICKAEADRAYMDREAVAYRTGTL